MKPRNLHTLMKLSFPNYSSSLLELIWTSHRFCISRIHDVVYPMFTSFRPCVWTPQIHKIYSKLVEVLEQFLSAFICVTICMSMSQFLNVWPPSIGWLNEQDDDTIPDIDDICELLQKAVILVGHGINRVSWFRRVHVHHNELSLLLSQPPPSVTIIITTTTICHYLHHNHHHLSLSSSQPPPSVTLSSQPPTNFIV